MSIATSAQQEPAQRGQSVGRVVGLLAEFDSADQVKAAAERVRDGGYTRWDVHSPYPIHGIDAAIGIRATKLPWLVFFGGCAGCLIGIVLTWWTNAAWHGDYSSVPTFLQGYQFQVSGKPAWSFPANVPVIFELTVLLAALAAVFGMFALNNLPLFHNPIFASQRFLRVTDDRFFISIEAADPRFRESDTRHLLESLHSAHVEEIREQPGSAELPGVFRHVAAVSIFIALIPLALIWMARNSKSASQPIHIIQDMDNQEKYKALQANAAFADHRASRAPVAGVVAAGDVLLGPDGKEDAHYMLGLVAGDYAPKFPTHRPSIKISESFIRRGQDRFAIYCSPCHGLDGRGQGAVAVRAGELGGAWVPPSDLHDADRKSRPVGHIFNTITSGIRNMPSYADQIPVDDRWAIVAYVKTLQRSTSGTLDDLPPEQRSELSRR